MQGLAPLQPLLAGEVVFALQELVILGGIFYSHRGSSGEKLSTGKISLPMVSPVTLKAQERDGPWA